MQSSNPEVIIPKAEVLRRLGGISSTTLWRMCRKNQFPGPIAISENRKGWLESDLAGWIASKSLKAAA